MMLPQIKLDVLRSPPPPPGRDLKEAPEAELRRLRQTGWGGWKYRPGQHYWEHHAGHVYNGLDPRLAGFAVEQAVVAEEAPPDDPYLAAYRRVERQLGVARREEAAFNGRCGDCRFYSKRDFGPRYCHNPLVAEHYFDRGKLDPLPRGLVSRPPSLRG